VISRLKALRGVAPGLDARKVKGKETILMAPLSTSQLVRF